MKYKTVGIVDLGAGSGKVFSLKYDGSILELKEHFRFPNHPVSIHNNLYNDVLYLYDQAKYGLIKTSYEEAGLISVGFDTWGNDYGLLDSKGQLISNPYNYRDLRTADFDSNISIPFDQHYAVTGIPCVRTNTYFQLRTEQSANRASHFLMTPDLYAYFMTGNISSEYVVTSTSSLVSASSRNWADEILKTLPVDKDIFPEIVSPGTDIGIISDPELKLNSLIGTHFIKTASHDTGSAVISTPIDKKSIYLSCGSMSLIGIVVDGYLVNQETFRWKYHNQGLPDGKMRVQRSFPALWIMQQCLKFWRTEIPKLSFSDIEKLASQAKPFHSYINVLDNDFSQPAHMPQKIQNYCKRTAQPIPQTIGEIARCLYESIAVKCRIASIELDSLSHIVHDKIYVMGGGIKDSFLMQMLADSTGKMVKLGLKEASATGNGIMQLISLGEIKNIEEAREIVLLSLSCSNFYPKQNYDWIEWTSRAIEIENNN